MTAPPRWVQAGERRRLSARSKAGPARRIVPSSRFVVPTGPGREAVRLPVSRLAVARGGPRFRTQRVAVFAATVEPWQPYHGRIAISPAPAEGSLPAP